MRYLTLTFQNIKKFITGHPILFIFLFVVQLICFIEVLICCGMAYNMNYVEKEYKQQEFVFGFMEEEDDKTMSVTVSGDGSSPLVVQYSQPNRQKESDIPLETAEFPNALTVPEAKESLDALIGDLEDYHLRYVIFRFELGKKIEANNPYLGEYFSFYPGFYQPMGMDIDNYVDSSEHIVLAPVKSLNGGRDNPFCPFKLGETANLNGTEYKCVGEYPYYFIPYHALSDDFAVTVLALHFEDYLNSKEIEKIYNIVARHFPIHPDSIQLPDPIDPDEIQYTQMLFILSAVVMMIVLLAIAKLYSFILSERKNNLVIMRLCGCTRPKVHIVYMLEIFLTMTLSTAAGVLIFRHWLFEPIAGMYPSFREFFTTPVYWSIIGAYAVVAFIILAVSVIPSTKVSITEMRRKN